MQEQKLGTILWRGKWLVAIATGLCVALALFVTKTSEKVYQATAIIQVTTPTTSGGGGDPFQTQQASQGLARTYATLIVDRSFLEKIRARVGNGAYTVAQLKERIRAGAVQETALIKVDVEGASPEQASALAADVSQAFLAVVRQDSTGRNGEQKREIEDQIERIAAQIEALSRSNNPADTERLASLRLARAALTQQLAELVADSARQSGSVSLTAPPTASGTPIRPRPMLNLAAGLMLGLLLGVLLAWVRSRLDRGLRDAEEVEELVSAPMLAAVPLRKRYVVDDAVLSEAYDILRANLAFLSLDQSIQAITFTSANPGEGKTSSVEGLAYAAVRAGMSVLLVDGDVRTCSLSSQFGARSLPGLTSVIVGTSRLEDSVLEIVPGLALLPAGPKPPNPPSLLSSGRMRELLGELRERHGLVIIDAPPVSHLADASILAGISDGVVLVARVGVTNRSDLPAAVANLRHTPTPIVGTVVLRPQVIDDTYYPVQDEGRLAVGDLIAEH